MASYPVRCDWSITSSVWRMKAWQSLNFYKEYLFGFETLVFATLQIVYMHKQLETLQRERKHEIASYDPFNSDIYIFIIWKIFIRTFWQISWIFFFFSQLCDYDIKMQLWYTKCITENQKGWMKISAYSVGNQQYKNILCLWCSVITGSSTVPETTYTSICLFPSSCGQAQSSSKTPFCSQMKLRITV